MTQEEILNGNPIIAEFMGGKYIRDESLSFEPKGRWHNLTDVASDALQDYNLKYHSSWDWLMPVVEKINKTHNSNLVHRDLTYTLQYLLNSGYGFTDYKREWLPMTVENVWLRCVEFIKWYNLK